MTLVSHIVSWLQQLVFRLTVRCGTTTVDFGQSEAYEALVIVDVGLAGYPLRAGCVMAQIAPIKTADHTIQDHIAHSPHFAVLCGEPDADGIVDITVSSAVPRTGKYTIKWWGVI